MYINTLWLDAYVNSLPLRYINTLWLEVYVRYTPWYKIMLDIPQQNPLKYGFSGIDIYIYIYNNHQILVHKTKYISIE